MIPSMRASAAPLATPRPDDRLHVTFVQMGGTIDKDYPRMQGGYARVWDIHTFVDFDEFSLNFH